MAQVDTPAEGGSHPRKEARLPPFLRPHFWDSDFGRLNWERDRDHVIGRILASGDWAAVSWLRSHCGDEALREWLEGRRGAGLSPRRLRFWELVLGLPHRHVTEWLGAQQRQVWDQRLHS